MGIISGRPKSLKRQLYGSLFRSALSKYVVYAVSVLCMLVLARFYTPEIFGVVALAMVIYTFSQLLAEAGVGPAIINLTALEPRARNGIFTAIAAVGLVAALIMVASASLVSDFFGEPRLAHALNLLSVAVFFQAMASVPIAFLLREQRFYQLAGSGLVSELLSTAVCLFLSGTAEPTYGLASKMPTFAICHFGITLILTRRTEFGMPFFGSHLGAILAIGRASIAQFGFNAVNFFSRNLDNILVGKFFTFSDLGFYDRAYQLMRYPLLLLSFALVPAIQPVVRNVASDIGEVESLNRDLAVRLSIVSVLASWALYFGSFHAVVYLLGPNWAETGKLLSILSISVPAQVISATSGSFYQARGKMGVLFFSGLATAVVNVTFIGIGIIGGSLETLCLMLVVSFQINFLINYVILYRWVFLMSPLRFFAQVGVLIWISSALLLVLHLL